MIVDLGPYVADDDCAVYHGDGAEVLPALGVKADLILTSPPYDDLRTYGGHGFDFDRMADACVETLADGGVLVWIVGDATVDGSETGTSFRQALGFMERGLRLHDTMIWQKQFGNPAIMTRYIQAFEYMFILSKGQPCNFSPIMDRRNVVAGNTTREDSTGRPAKDKKVRTGRKVHRKTWGARTNVWYYHTGTESNSHPAHFPLALAADHIRTWTHPGDLVMDPMVGSGTVLKAARQQGRRSIGVEIHDEYLPLIADRMAQQTLGLEAVL